MKKIFISSFDMEVGGVERSLINLLDNLDYNRYKTDLFLYRQAGEFLNFINSNVSLLPEVYEYTTFRKGILELIKEKQLKTAFFRISAKVKSFLISKMSLKKESGYLQMQLTWENQINDLPSLDNDYDVAISYLWPHHFVAKKVNADKKIAWIHTDYSMIDIDVKRDLKVWNCYDHIIAVSEDCKNSFLKKFPSLVKKVSVIENISAPNFVKKLSLEQTENSFFSDQRFKVLTVARFSHAKGIDNAVRALKKLVDKGHDIVWYVIGYGGDENLIKRLIQENKLQDNFILLGKKINPYPFIRSCDLYVQPSRYEGKAVTIVEAQILSKPVLITNYSTAASQISDGSDGFICNGTPLDLSNAIEDLMLLPQKRNKVEKMCERTNYNNVAELEKIYKIIELNQKKDGNKIYG